MLFYSQHRTHVAEYETTPEWRERFDKFGPRFFAHVRWNDDGPPTYGSKTNAHSW